MQRVFKKASKINQQTWALLWKNILLVWRKKTEIIQISSTLIYHFERQEIPYKFLGRLDDPAFRVKGVTLIYTPVTSTTREIMERVASNSVMKARGLHGVGVIGVVFKDDFSYHLRFQSYSVKSPIDAFEYIEMKSISGIRLQSPLIKSIYKLDYIWFTIYSMLCFSPFMYFLSVKVIREKKKLKVLMKAMGLQDIAFWLSWSLLYTIYISVTSSLLTVITIRRVTQDCSFSEIYFLYFFYGIASVSLLSSLLKRPHITSFVGFFLHIVFGSLGFMTLFEQVPPSLEWVFKLFSPYTFTAGISEIVKLEKYGPTVAPELYPFFNLYSMLILDSTLYLLLAIYFDKVLPGKYGVPYPPLFFLRPSYWLQRGSECGIQPDSIPVPGCDTEPIPEGFEGKEAIRLYNIRKTYKSKDKRTEALRGLSLNIYEGQITALLGLSGSGKTALLDVLSGFSKPSAGSAMICNYKVSEVQDMEGIQAMVGICPQSNLHFEALTVKENLRIFAHVKGIWWKEAEQEVQKVLVQLDLTDLQDVRADSLSGGQKRKLSLAIAILGDPQVLLLDEPMVGLDPCSRHQVWELLAERRAGRVTLICTQSVEEADTCTDRKAFLSNGRLHCVGSSLYLKRKWGIGYHLRMCINDQCDPGLASSLVRRYIPNAVFKGRDGDELCYLLPLENTKSFPDLLGHLDSGLVLGIVHYDVSRTTLADALLKLEGREAIDHRGKAVIPLCKMKGSYLFSVKRNIGMELWRQQVLAVARVLGTAFSTPLNLLILPFPSQIKARAQLRVSGLFPSAYWCGQALVDVPLFWALMCLMFVFVLLLDRICPMEAFIILPMVAIGYGVSLTFLVYLIAFMFRKGRTNRYLWSFVFVLVSGGNLHSETFDNTSYHLKFHFECVEIQQNNPNHVLFGFLLCCLEIRYGEAVAECDPIFRCVLGALGAAGIAWRLGDKVLITIITINTSCTFVPGEVLGLLGPNGAGKSTTVRMISGDTAATAGEVMLQGSRAMVLGCCPQKDPLWPDLTVLQHLEAYAAVRGVRREDAAVLISRMAKALDLQRCLKTPARKLSAGEARKLCFALSILGNPTVMLWDEPSAGMDVAGQHCLWKAIRAAVRSKECAAVLSTHCLEEAAMCDRVAVLVAGKLQYIGSPEELRRKFGMNYNLEVKLKDMGQSDALHNEIVHLFPGAARLKRISSLLTYKIPMEDALPLSQAFSKLEAAKQNFRLEEYSLSLHTLKQVCWFGMEVSEMLLKERLED
uniref:ATP-binding cassette sub-family A member 9-like n=1 Tax=Coturnix japonica TaxID=93934 RepID=A0A8C2UIM8_COTJA